MRRRWQELRKRLLAVGLPVFSSPAGPRAFAGLGLLLGLLLTVNTLNVINSYAGRDLMTSVAEGRLGQFYQVAGVLAGVFAASTLVEVSMRYTERLADAGIAPSVGSRGDSYDNALAESIIGLFKTEVIQRKGPWRHLEAVEFATLRWVDWFNNRRLLEPIGYVPPAEYEASYYAQAHRDAPVGHEVQTGALGGILSSVPQSLAAAADRLQDSL